MILNHYFKATSNNSNSYWAIGPEIQRDSIRSDDDPNRWSIPDFVVFQHGCFGEIPIDANEYCLAQFGIREHTFVECKRTDAVTLEDGMHQLSEQCSRMEKPGDCCFAILNIGLKVWFFEYSGSDYSEEIFKRTYNSTGLIFIMPLKVRGSYNPIEGLHLINDRRLIHFIFMYLGTYKWPRFYDLS